MHSARVKNEMEFMSSLQNGFDDHKPSVFGKDYETQLRKPLLTISRTTLRAAIIQPHSPISTVPVCHSDAPTSTVSSPRSQFF